MINDRLINDLDQKSLAEIRDKYPEKITDIKAIDCLFFPNQDPFGRVHSSLSHTRSSILYLPWIPKDAPLHKPPGVVAEVENERLLRLAPKILRQFEPEGLHQIIPLLRSIERKLEK